jgi:hypothetical protein
MVADTIKIHSEMLIARKTQQKIRRQTKYSKGRCSFPTVTITNYHKLDGFKSIEMYALLPRG